MSNITLIGIDIAKSVFQLCGLNKARKVLFNKKVTRAKFVDAVRQHPDATLVMEACGGSHYWARTFTEMGFKVRLVPAQHVKAFSRGNKSDANDALAIAETAFRPDLFDVQHKSLEQQDIQTLLRIRTRIKGLRRDNVNQTRGLLAEYGIVMPKTIRSFDRHLPDILENADNALTPIARRALHDLYLEHRALCKKVTSLDRQFSKLIQLHPIANALTCIKGIGPITALALYATIGKGQQFKNARQLAAWLGLVPQQHGTGGITRLGPISKRGDSYLRLLLIHGARVVMRWANKLDDPLSDWAKQVAARRGKHKAIVAIANKTARMVWVVLHKGADALPSHYQTN